MPLKPGPDGCININIPDGIVDCGSGCWRINPDGQGEVCFDPCTLACCPNPDAEPDDCQSQLTAVAPHARATLLTAQSVPSSIFAQITGMTITEQSGPFDQVATFDGSCFQLLKSGTWRIGASSTGANFTRGASQIDIASTRPYFDGTRWVADQLTVLRDPTGVTSLNGVNEWTTQEASATVYGAAGEILCLGVRYKTRDGTPVPVLGDNDITPYSSTWLELTYLGSEGCTE